MDDRRRASVAVLRVVGWLVSLLTVGFVIRTLVRAHLQWTDVVHLKWGWVVIGILFMNLWYYLRGIIWLGLLQDANSVENRAVAMKRWALSEMLRYIPGNVWSFVGRYRGAAKEGTTAGKAWSVIVVEIWVLLTGAIVATSIFDWQSRWMWWLIGGLASVVVLPFILKLLKRWTTTMRWNRLLWFALLSTISWATYGLGMAAIFRAMPNVPVIGWATLIGVNVAAWMVGYLSLITPMGLGVREVALVSFLGDSGVTAGLASLAATIGRIVLILSEGVFLLFLELRVRAAKPVLKKVE